jgi:hypothetical protein
VDGTTQAVAFSVVAAADFTLTAPADVSGGVCTQPGSGGFFQAFAKTAGTPDTCTTTYPDQFVTFTCLGGGFLGCSNGGSGITTDVTPDPSVHGWCSVGGAVAGLTVPTTVAPGQYSISVQANGGGFTHQASVPLTVLPRSSPEPQTIAGSSSLHSNLGFLPIDYYDDNHTPAQVGNSLAVSCPGATTVRSCYRAILGDFASQHVTGVRFFFPLCGGLSTPIKNCGCGAPNSPQACTTNNLVVTSPSTDGSDDSTNPWTLRLGNFFQDLATVGILNVTATMAHDEAVDTSPYNVQFKDRNTLSAPTALCVNTPPRVRFVSTQPFGQFPWSDSYDDPSQCPPGQTCPAQYSYRLPIDDGFDGYSCSPANPIFVGWQHMDNAAGAVIRTAARFGINVTQFEGEQELNTVSFPVQARYIYDNTQAPVHDSISTIGAYMNAAYPNANPSAQTRVTWSAIDSQRTLTPTEGQQNCTDVYTGNARAMDLESIASVIGNGYFGRPFGASADNGLLCGGHLCSDGVHDFDCPDGFHLMQQAHVYQPQPSIMDLHTYPCISPSDPHDASYGGCYPDARANVKDEAVDVFNAISHYLGLVQNQSATVMLGETHTTGVTSCSQINGQPTPGVHCELHAPADAAAFTVMGYNQSCLNAANSANGVCQGNPSASSVIFRPFINVWPGGAGNNCYFPPGNRQINPNNQGPYKPFH